MRMSIRIKIMIAIILGGLVIYAIVVLFSQGKIDSSEYKQEFTENIRQSEEFKDIQLDSATVYAEIAVVIAEVAENDLWINQS